jgi:sulfur-oxidizing protein SoxY
MRIVRRQISLSAPRGGEGWPPERPAGPAAPGEVGDSRELAAPTSPSRRHATGPSLSPLKGGEGRFGGGQPTRRWIILATAGAAVAPCARHADATQAAMAEAIRALIGEAEPQQGKVKLELPSLVENGNTVPLTVSVDSPITEADHVESIHIFNQKNPQPYVAAFKLGPRTERAQVSTGRLAARRSNRTACRRQLLVRQRRCHRDFGRLHRTVETNGARIDQPSGASRAR